MIEKFLMALWSVWTFISISVGMVVLILGLTAVLNGGRVHFKIVDSHHTVMDHCFGNCEGLKK